MTNGKDDDLLDCLRDRPMDPAQVEAIARIYDQYQISGDYPFDEIEAILGKPNHGVTAGGNTSAGQYFASSGPK